MQPVAFGWQALGYLRQWIRWEGELRSGPSAVLSLGGHLRELLLQHLASLRWEGSGGWMVGFQVDFEGLGGSPGEVVCGGIKGFVTF